MNKYGQAALRAMQLLDYQKMISPQDAWEVGTIEIFGKGSDSQTKGCPKSTFLGLCESGMVKGIKPGKYTQSKKNKEYAIKAVELLKHESSDSYDTIVLWKKIIGEVGMSHNSQMDVVLALWNGGFII